MQNDSQKLLLNIRNFCVNKKQQNEAIFKARKIFANYDTIYRRLIILRCFKMNEKYFTEQ